MIIHNQEIKMDSAKIILSKNPFKLTHHIVLKNDALVIAPWTKYSDIFNYKKNNFLANMIDENFQQHPNQMLNTDFIIKTMNQINKEAGFEFLDFDQRLAKVFKEHLPVVDDYLNQNLKQIIEYINKYSRMKTSIVIIGFDEIASDIIKSNLVNIDVVLITTSLKNSNIDEKFLETIIIEYGNNELLQIYDISVLKSWLETKTNLSLENNDINDYFKNVINDKTILIEKAIQSI